MSVLDAHVHVWDDAVLPHPWIASAPALAGPFLPSDVDDGGGRVASWIFVEADAAPGRALDEVAWVESLAWPGLVGIVAAADLRDPRLAAHLAALRASPLVVGVRHLLQDADAATIRSDEVAAGLRLVRDAGLVFDLCVRSWQLEACADVLDRVEGATIVLDHLGKPPVDAGLASAEGRAWLAGLARLAERGVAVQCSGLAAEASSRDALRRHAPDLIRAALDLVGPERMLVGGDWPVSGTPAGGATTAEWLELVESTVGAQAWPWVSARTARRVYGLDDA